MCGILMFGLVLLNEFVSVYCLMHYCAVLISVTHKVIDLAFLCAF